MLLIERMESSIESIIKYIIPSHSSKRQLLLMGKMDTHSFLKEMDINKLYLLMKEQRICSWWRGQIIIRCSRGKMSVFMDGRAAAMVDGEEVAIVDEVIEHWYHWYLSSSLMKLWHVYCSSLYCVCRSGNICALVPSHHSQQHQYIVSTTAYNTIKA